MNNKLYKITMRDSMGFADGFVSHAHYTCILFVAIPPEWVAGGTLSKDYQEKILQRMYGENWRNENEDGSYFMVTQFLYEEVQPSQTPWKEYENNGSFRCWFWEVQGDAIVDVTVDQFV